MAVTRVLLADDHQLFREGLANILNGQPDFEVVGEAGDGWRSSSWPASWSPTSS